MARFNNPWSLAVANDGSIYVADSGNHAIRRITPKGKVTTFTNDLVEPLALTFSRATDQLYVGDQHAVKLVDSDGKVTLLAGRAKFAGETDGLGQEASFRRIYGMAVTGDGTVYVSDTRSKLIRKITANGKVTTIAGSSGQYGDSDGQGSSARFGTPTGVVAAGEGNVYVADPANAVIRKVTPKGEVTTVAGMVPHSGHQDGPGVQATFDGLSGIVVGANSTVYVLDAGGYVRKITAAGDVSTLMDTTSLAGLSSEPEQGSNLTSPTGNSIDSSCLVPDGGGGYYALESYSSVLWHVSKTGEWTIFAGSLGQSGVKDGVAGQARFFFPSGLARDGAGNLYVADSGNRTIRKVTLNATVTTIGGQAGIDGGNDGVGPAAHFSYPTALTCGQDGRIYVIDLFDNRVILGAPLP